MWHFYIFCSMVYAESLVLTNGHIWSRIFWGVFPQRHNWSPIIDPGFVSIVSWYQRMISYGKYSKLYLNYYDSCIKGLFTLAAVPAINLKRSMWWMAFQRGLSYAGKRYVVASVLILTLKRLYHWAARRLQRGTIHMNESCWYTVW